MNTSATFIIPASKKDLAVQITDDLGYPEKGMFIVPVDGVAFTSTGIVDSDCPLLGTPEELYAALQERNPETTITLAECQDFVANLDLTSAEPHGRMASIVKEVSKGAEAVAWVDPRESLSKGYQRDEVVTVKGQAWLSLVDDNVAPPGGKGWRKLFGEARAKEPGGVEIGGKG